MPHDSEIGDYLRITFPDEESSVCSTNTKCKTAESKRLLPFANSPLYTSTIIDAKKLTKGEDVKTVYSVTLDVKDINHKFEAGDTIGILPCNNENEVDQILLRLNLTSLATKTYKLCIVEGTSKKNATIPVHIPNSGTLREIFIKNIDIRSPPKKLFLKTLMRYTTEKEELEKLQHLCSPKGSQEYTEFITQNRSLISLLNVFPSCYPSVALLLENLPPLQPRPYSISSSPLLLHELQITFSVISIDKNTCGVCSGWLETVIQGLHDTKQQDSCNASATVEEELQNLNLNLAYEISIPFYFRKFNNFRIPIDPTIPIIMIGPGTGIAPYIGFLQHRHLQTKRQSHTKFGTSWLFYGCRYSDRDFLFKPEIEEFLQSGTLSKLFTCYSREGSTKTYKYVQDAIKSQCKDVVDKIVRENATVYVCGDAKNMAKDVRNVIISCLVDVEGWSSVESDTYIKHLQQSDRYIQDVWL